MKYFLFSRFQRELVYITNINDDILLYDFFSRNI